jgi:hypothetical protein
MERFEFQFSSATTEPPTLSQLRLNNADPALATKIWIMNDTTPGEDVSKLLRSLPLGAIVYVQDYDDHLRYYGYRIDAAPVDKTTYVELPVIWLGSGQPLLTQKITLVTFMPFESAAPATPYASRAELQSILQLKTPTALQFEEMDRVLQEAAEEINWELGYSATNPAPQPPPALVVGVNLNRAVEHWRQMRSPFGVIGVGSESEPIVTARNTWYRHHLKLAPLKAHQGLA